MAGMALVGALRAAIRTSFSAAQTRQAATIINIHKHSDGNNSMSPFEFSAETMAKVETILANYPANYKQSAVIPVLDVAQQQNRGFLSLAAMDKVAKVLDMAPIRVYEVATFYSMFNRQPVGKFHVMVCGTTPCMLRGSRDIEKALSEKWDTEKFGTTRCGTFTLGEMECMGSCVNAPMVAVADYSNGIDGYSYKYYEDLTPESVVKLVDDLEAGRDVREGSQIRDKAEPVSGLTSLTETPPGPSCRKLEHPPPPEEKK